MPLDETLAGGRTRTTRSEGPSLAIRNAQRSLELFETLGYDPSAVADPLYFLDVDKYVPLDGSLFEAIQSGEKVLR